MKKISDMFQSVSYWIGVMVIGVVVGISLQIASAVWTNPTLPPPTGNVDAPINVGSNVQNKLGSLGLGGFLDTQSYIHATGDICTDAGGGKCLSAVSGGGSSCSIEGSLVLASPHTTGQSGQGTGETATVTGASVGDQVLVQGKSPCPLNTAYVSAPNTVLVFFPNPAGSSSCTSPAGTYKIRVIKANCAF